MIKTNDLRVIFPELIAAAEAKSAKIKENGELEKMVLQMEQQGRKKENLHNELLDELECGPGAGQSLFFARVAARKPKVPDIIQHASVTPQQQLEDLVATYHRLREPCMHGFDLQAQNKWTEFLEIHYKNPELRQAVGASTFDVIVMHRFYNKRFLS